MKTLKEFSNENLDVQELLTTEELSVVMGGLCWGGSCTAGQCTMGKCTMGSCTMGDDSGELAVKVVKLVADINYPPSIK